MRNLVGILATGPAFFVSAWVLMLFAGVVDIDVGTAAATLLLAAHSIGLGAGPVTSFSRTALATILRLPAEVRPELIICLGHAATEQPPAMRRQDGPRWDDLIQ